MSWKFHCYWQHFCGPSDFRILQYVDEFFFQLSGLALIVVGAVIKEKYGDFVKVSSNSLTTGPVFLIIIGVIVAIVGFLGCCGAYKENYCMVTTVSAMQKRGVWGEGLCKKPKVL